MAKHEKKPKHWEIDFEIHFLGFRLKFHYSIDW